MTRQENNDTFGAQELAQKVVLGWSSSETHWEKEAVKLLTTVFLHLCETNEKQSIDDEVVSQALNFMCDGNTISVLKNIQAAQRSKLSHEDSVVSESCARFQLKEERERRSIFATAMAALAESRHPDSKLLHAG